MRKQWMLVALVLVSLVSLTIVGCGSKVSKSNFDKIVVRSADGETPGMTLADVQALLGEGTQQQGGVLEGITGTVYVWEDGDRKITVTFVDDHATTKLPEGL